LAVEIEESITTGLPLLVEECEREETNERRHQARAELDRRLEMTLQLVRTTAK
jgi:hypothetical protein